jgi:hypothetical protein
LRSEYAIDPPQTKMALYGFRNLLVTHYNRETAPLVEADVSCSGAERLRATMMKIMSGLSSGITCSIPSRNNAA